MLRQRRPRAYSDDSDVETERKDKTFKAPVPFKDLPTSRKLLVCLGLFALGILALMAVRAATIAVLQEPNGTGILGFSCVDIGTTSADHSKFTFVVLGHLTLQDKDLRSSLRAIVPHVLQRESIVIGLRKKRKVEHMVNLVSEELKTLVNTTSIRLCESNHANEAWRELWRRRYVAREFIILDQIELFTSSWRDWVADMRRKNPKSILSLQKANDQYVIGTDHTSQFKISTVPSFAALIPPALVWSEFLQWFDKDKAQFERIGGHSLSSDLRDDGWQQQTLGHHASWTKPFAQFIAMRQYKVLHAHPAAAYSMYERRSVDV